MTQSVDSGSSNSLGLPNVKYMKQTFENSVKIWDTFLGM